MQIKRRVVPALSVSDYVIFLIWNVQLLLGNALDGVIIPLLAGVIGVYKTLLLTKHLITLLRTVTELAV